MTRFTKTNSSGADDQEVPEYVRAAGYLERREQQILQTEQAIAMLQGAIHNVMDDIARYLSATPSADNQAILEQSFGELQSLAKAVESSASAATRSDGGGDRGVSVDLSDIKAAIDSRANASSGASFASAAGLPEDSHDTKRNSAKKIKDLSRPDAQSDSGSDQNSAGDTKPNTDPPNDAKPAAADTPTRKVDRFKLALAKGDIVSVGDGDQSAITNAKSSALDTLASHVDQIKTALAKNDGKIDLPPPLPDKLGTRPNAAVLKLNHAEAVTNAGTPDALIPTSGAATTKAALAQANTASNVAVALGKPVSPAGP